MKYATLILAVLVLVVVSASAATNAGRVQLEALPIIPAGWKTIGKASQDKFVKLQIALKQSNVDKLMKIFNEVSNPDHERYGKYLTTEQIGELVKPSETSLSRIHAWLESAGIKTSQGKLSLHMDFLTIRLTIAQAESLLQTQFNEYQSMDGRTLSRASTYTVPQSVASDIDFIGGVVRFPPTKKHHVQSYTQQFETLDKHQKSALMTPGNPIVSYMLIGDGKITVDFALRCPDGSGATSLTCPSGYRLASVSVGDSDSIQLSTTSASKGSVFCRKPFTDGILASREQAIIKQYHFTPSTLFCSVTAEFANFEVYNNVELTVWTEHLDGFSTPLPSFSPSPWVTPRKLQDFYGIPSGLKNSHAKNGQSVSEFLGQYYDPKDLSDFMRLMGLPDYKVDKVLGPNNVTNPGGEASLDIEYILGISNNVTTWFWSLGELHEGQEPFLEWLIQISNTPVVPFVHSTSYADEEQSLTKSYMDRVGTELVKAGVRGLTLLFSSGDDGVGGYTQRTQPNICQQRGFAPEFPSSSPYVTAVGGTQFSTKSLPICNNPVGHLQYDCDTLGEIVSSSTTGSRITSGGGFSINFPAPTWQTAPVQQYLKTLAAAGQVPPKNMFNVQGRAFPDISGMAHNYLCTIGGEIVPVDGTSASTPLTAAMLTLVNDRLLTDGKPTLGFFNPLLYKMAAEHPQAFNDIVVGSNACSVDANICCPFGFPATPGWDASTGFGTFNFPAMYKYLTGVFPTE